MTRLPVLSSRKVITALRRAGLVELTGRGKGSHHRLYHPNDLTITVTVPHHREIKRGTLHNIIEDAGLTREEFLNLL